MVNGFPSSILIVKTSSLGDIIQAFSVLDTLHIRFPKVQIDWAVETRFLPIVASHPLIRRTIPMDIKTWKNLLPSLKDLRQERYDCVFDLQANTKSGLVTFFSRSSKKIGYSYASVREWPNLLSTNLRFNISKEQNIRSFYLELVASYFQESMVCDFPGVFFKISEEEKELVEKIAQKASQKKAVMVCPGSKWQNKQLPKKTLLELLQKIQQRYDTAFFLVWGDLQEKALCQELEASLPSSYILDRLQIPVWQNVMNNMDLVLAVDSSALHLCGTTSTPSFSVFGPTSLKVFKPIGKKHCGIQGKCPYGQVFIKQCPLLRDCETGACIKDLTSEELFQAFQSQCDFLRSSPPREFSQDLHF